eukprot:2018533-Heterocapsa_arctica.AAC.1
MARARLLCLRIIPYRPPQTAARWIQQRRRDVDQVAAEAPSASIAQTTRLARAAGGARWTGKMEALLGKEADKGKN